MVTGLLTPTHLVLVLLVALIVFGPKRLPAAGRALGDSLREFKDSVSGISGSSDDSRPELDGADTAR